MIPLVQSWFSQIIYARPTKCSGDKGPLPYQLPAAFRIDTLEAGIIGRTIVFV